MTVVYVSQQFPGIVCFFLLSGPREPDLFVPEIREALYLSRLTGGVGAMPFTAPRYMCWEWDRHPCKDTAAMARAAASGLFPTVLKQYPIISGERFVQSTLEYRRVPWEARPKKLPVVPPWARQESGEISNVPFFDEDF